MPKRFEGRIAVVTGGGAGIGAAICKRLAQEGAQVLVADIDGEAAEQVAQGLGSSSMACQVDVSDEAQVESLVAKALKWGGRLDIWVNNAAKFVFGAATTATGAGTPLQH